MAVQPPPAKLFSPGTLYPGDSISAPITNNGHKLIITMRTNCEYYVNTAHGMFKAEAEVDGSVNFRYIGAGVLGFVKNGVVDPKMSQIKQSRDANGLCRWCHGTKTIPGATPGSRGWPCNEC